MARHHLLGLHVHSLQAVGCLFFQNKQNPLPPGWALSVANRRGPAVLRLDLKGLFRWDSPL